MIMEITSRLTHRSLMNKSKHDLASMVLDRCDAQEEAHKNYLGACGTIAEMHAAAVGKVAGPNRGVVEDVADVRAALAESVKLQAHYAKLLNMHDGGERMIFEDVDEWVARVRSCQAAT